MRSTDECLLVALGRVGGAAGLAAQGVGLVAGRFEIGVAVEGNTHIRPGALCLSGYNGGMQRAAEEAERNSVEPVKGRKPRKSRAKDAKPGEIAKPATPRPHKRKTVVPMVWARILP